ncbi:hypothetical protein [Bradyrhizobium sp. B117]|uniref:hypothetical protein n=1 Tax=Bradyrhizobium sp. B117 TaxID=3140246 RepID=UPI003182F8F3
MKGSAGAFQENAMPYCGTVTREEIEAAKQAYERAQQALVHTSEVLRRSREVLGQSFKILGINPDQESTQE